MGSSSNINAKLFAQFAGTNQEKWRNFFGSNMEHKTKGIGKLIDIDEGNYLIINFNDSDDDFPSLFSIDGFEKYFNYLTMSANLKDDYLGELQTIEHFEKLKLKYSAEGYADTDPLSDLYLILLNIELTTQLDDKAISWLDKNQLYKTLSLYFEKKYKINGNLWDLVLAAKHARKGDLPERALDLTNIILTDDINEIGNRVLSALYTVRGATFRYMGRFAEAIEMGNRAINLPLENNFYPYNLLGGIYYDIGDPQKGDEYFKIAENLGSSKAAIDKAIEKSFSKADDDTKRNNAEYLLKQDPARYNWVKKYLQSSFAFTAGTK